MGTSNKTSRPLSELHQVKNSSYCSCAGMHLVLLDGFSFEEHLLLMSPCVPIRTRKDHPSFQRNPVLSHSFP